MGMNLPVIESVPEATHVVTSPKEGWRPWMVGAGFAVLFGVTTWFLVFAPQGSPLYGDVAGSERHVRSEGALTIAYDQPLSTYEPTVSDVVTRGYLANTYEGLVRFDRNLTPEPALALSWGMLSDQEWQFKLRPGILFHDGSAFTAEDVVSSLDRAREHADSESAVLTESIRSVTEVDALTVKIRTVTPDILLLNKLTLIPMVSSSLGVHVTQPVGTGPYAFVSATADQWVFSRFQSYWGALPSFPELRLRSIPDKVKRYEALLSGEVDVLSQVAPVFVGPLLDQNFLVASQPGLEVSFLKFNAELPNGSVRSRAVREALLYALDPVALVRMAGGYAQPIGQFVSRGVFGYAPALDPFPYDPERARRLIASVGEGMVVTLDLPRGLKTLGDYVSAQWTAVGLRPNVVYHEDEAYAEVVRSGKSEVLFAGWRSPLGDASDFFTSLVHSKESEGASNVELDRSIENMARTTSESLRVEQLHTLMDTVVNEVVWGVPLFESDTLVGLRSDLQWEPRVDNLILAADFY